MSFQLTGGRFKAFDNSSPALPLVGGQLLTFVSGTTTPKATYTDATLSTPNPTTITLDARGEAQVWLGTGAYSIKLLDANGVQIWTADGLVDNGAASAAALLAYQQAVAGASGDSNMGTSHGTAHAHQISQQAKNRLTFFVAEWGAVGDDSTNDTSAVLNAINETPAGGTLVLRGSAGEIFRTDGINATRSNITIIGSAKPKANSVHTALEGGTIIRGSFVINGDNLHLEKFGADCGIDYSNAYKGGAGDNGLVVHDPALATIRRGITARDCIGMARVGSYLDLTAAYHAVLLEGLDNGCSDNVTGVGGLYGVVLKATNWAFNGLTGIENDSVGVYIKSNSYAPVANVTGVNVNVIAGGSRAFFGLRVSASDAQLNTVSVDGVTVIGGGSGGPVTIDAEGTQPNVATVVTGITTRATAQGVNVNGPVYAARARGIIDKPSTGVSLVVQANTVAVSPNDVTVDIRSNVDPANAAVNQCVISSGGTRVWLERFYATISYAATVGNPAGKVQVSANTQIGDVYGVLSCDTTEANLTNGWAVFTAGQHCGTLTRNGTTFGYGRIKFGAATGDAFLTLPDGAYPASTGFLTAITGFAGVNSEPLPVYVSVSSTGVCSISPNRAAYAGVSYIDLTSLRFPAQLPINTAF